MSWQSRRAADAFHHHILASSARLHLRAQRVKCGSTGTAAADAALCAMYLRYLVVGGGLPRPSRGSRDPTVFFRALSARSRVGVVGECQLHMRQLGGVSPP